LDRLIVQVPLNIGGKAAGGVIAAVFTLMN
jgi:hypothetical protein